MLAMAETIVRMLKLTRYLFLHLHLNSTDSNLKATMAMMELVNCYQSVFENDMDSVVTHRQMSHCLLSLIQPPPWEQEQVFFELCYLFDDCVVEPADQNTIQIRDYK